MTAFMSIYPQTTYTRVYPHSPVCTGNLPTMQVYVLAYMCTCVQRAQPLSRSTHRCLSKKSSYAPQRQGNWVESMSLSPHLMALPAPLLALLTPYPFPRAHTQLISPLHTLSSLPEASTGDLLQGLICARWRHPTPDLLVGRPVN